MLVVRCFVLSGTFLWVNGLFHSLKLHFCWLYLNFRLQVLYSQPLLKDSLQFTKARYSKPRLIRIRFDRRCFPV